MVKEKRKGKKQKKTWVRKLKNKYRLVLMNDETFEERLSLKLSRLNVFVVVGSIIILLIVSTIYIIAFTPLREYIPGYTSVKMQKDVYKLQVKADSLEVDFKRKDVYINNIKNIIEGKAVSSPSSSIENKNKNYEEISISRSIDDSLLRNEFETENKYNVFVRQKKSFRVTPESSIKNFSFFVPVKGIITNEFNAGEKHFGIDIVTKKNEAVKATLDGTVVFANWTLETGYVIVVQHAFDIVSIYKHNAVLLKKQGAYVKAGEPIAVVGETGELITGPHLHFELWYNGSPVNPTDYMKF